MVVAGGSDTAGYGTVFLRDLPLKESDPEIVPAMLRDLPRYPSLTMRTASSWGGPQEILHGWGTLAPTCHA
ncbi:hypothetical protein MBOURGENBZM_06090 [Methanoculleus bourgensis]|nr:hypothetical protein MBOURGENBZM_06090 [Methanoculleus bourgensis]